MKKMCILFAFFFAFCLVGLVNLCIAGYVDDDDPKVDDNGYIMSWLILEPFISDTSQQAGPACEKDYFEDQGGVIKREAFGDAGFGQAVVADLFYVHETKDSSIRYNNLGSSGSTLRLPDENHQF